MRFLCVCDDGNVRSVAMAFILHEEYNHEAIAVGRLRVSPNTMEYLCNWADTIVLMQPCMKESIPEEFLDKVKVVDVGEDRYSIWIHPGLLPQVRTGSINILNSLGL